MLDLSIIIVNWNTRDLLRNCLRSIYKKTEGINYEVIVVDNASKDESTKMVKDEFPQVKLIENKKNVGFAKGNNQGFSLARGKYILLLNPDTELIDNSLLKMVNFLDLNKDAGAVGPKFLYPDGTFQRYYARFPTFLSVMTRWFFPDKLAYRIKSTRSYLMLDDDFSRIMEIEHIAAACIMVRRCLFSEENLMDERFPIFFGDVDLSHRIYDKGFKIYFLPEAQIIHYGKKGGTEQGKMTFSLSAECFLSLTNYFYKYHGVIKATLLRVLFSLSFGIRSLEGVAENLVGIKDKEELKYEIRRFYTFLTKKSVFTDDLPEKEENIQ